MIGSKALILPSSTLPISSALLNLPFAPHPLTGQDAAINSVGTVLLVDTGAPVDLLDDSELSRLGLHLERHTRAPTGSLIEADASARIIGLNEVGLHEIQVAKARTFALGARQWGNIAFGIGDLNPWNIAKPGTPRT